jgi:methionine-rich copper-binding protein CopC
MHFILTALLTAAFGASAAFAHAHLDHASPAAGSIVSPAPNEVSLSFTESLEPAFSTVTVTDAGGAEVSQGKAQVSGNIMRVGLKPLGPGTYKVNWHALSVDTHTTQGAFTFNVGGK